LRVVAFADERALKKVGSSLYDRERRPASSHRTCSPSLVERSNVEPVIEIAHMIEVLRGLPDELGLTKSGEDLLKQAIQKL